MNKNVVIILMCLTAGLSACNGGGNSSPAPTPSMSPSPAPTNLPNVFSLTSVKDLQLDILKLDNTAIVGNLNRTKVAGHVSYKIKLTNPNSFALNISKIKFDNESAYLLMKNNESDNCFNQSWYQNTSTAATLLMPAGGSCSLYTISPWIQSYTSDKSQAGGKYQQDFVNYTASTSGFVFSRSGTLRTGMWCESGCYPIGNKDSMADGSNNAINSKYYNWPISRSVFRNYPQNAFVQDGNSVVNIYQGSDYITMQKESVVYDANQLDLVATSANPPIVVYSAAGSSAVYSFYISRSGTQGLAGVRLFGQSGPSVIGLSIGEISSGYFIGALSNGTFLSGLNDVLYEQDHIYGIDNLDSNGILDNISRISPKLPGFGVLYGADTENNLIIKSNNKTACYIKNIYYESIPALSDLSDIQTQPIISSKYYYSRNSATSERFYNFDQLVISNPFSYQVNTTMCQTLPILLAAESQIIITEKYTAVATDLGYFFVSAQNTSSGENDDMGVN